ncbi:hypothetical protein SAMN04488038_10136 [Solimonas aquatica]|uniref:Uncharacterized protein n=1 Tax=Solimonas aquatica TaxID=489703 RepID=A0A1H8ZGX0_9GAMM|nr:hypothetical protein [Solimonas aquatica]SEP63656.1 hypothetical protein SAMN04488038_10136 [Solimonas aquatica]
MGDTTTTSAVQDGLASIESDASLTRLHYFDGKYLRADALTLEQDYHRQLVRLSNLAGGWGVVHGLGLGLSGDTLKLSSGLAITPAGSTVLLQHELSASLGELIKRAQPSPPNPDSVAGNQAFGDCECKKKKDEGSGVASVVSDWYEITVGPVQALCGQEEVYGKLCEDACVTDSQQPYFKEGLMLRLRPISLSLPDSSAVSLGATHLRNRMASAYFASEPWLSKSLLNAQGLNCEVWCQPAALYTRDEVPIGLLARQGGSTLFIDAWSARRERMDAQARGYWQGRMRMRPWNVFIAQILQFQCQLSGAFEAGSTAFTPLDSDCDKLRQLLIDSARELEAARAKYEAGNRKIMELLGGKEQAGEMIQMLEQPYQRIHKLAGKLVDAQGAMKTYTPNRLLLSSGFVELPPAGYLPVQLSQQAINEQMQRLFGEGVNLYFCTCRPDAIAGAVQDAQHLDRISLTRGLDDPGNKEDVEILVPDGQLLDAVSTDTGRYWQVALRARELMRLLPELLMVNSKQDLQQDFIQKKQKSDDSIRMESYQIDTEDDVESSDFAGLARSMPLETGGARLSLVCQPDAGKLFYARQLKSEMEKQQSDAQGAMAYRKRTLSALYVDLSIAEDPFTQAEGEELPLSLELRLLTTLDDGSGQPQTQLQSFFGEGRLTVGALYKVSARIQGAEVSIRMQLAMTEKTPDDETTKNGSYTLPLRLMRQGDARSGTLLAAAGDSDAGLGASWGEQPREAVFGPYQDAFSGTVYKQDMLHEKVRKLSYAQQSAPDIDPYVRLQELGAAPQPESPLRLNALNTLAQIADAAQDDAFLARARRRLFPDSAPADGVLRVRATRDWLAFRRRAPLRCDSDCGCPQASSIDAFQTWHYRAKSREEALKILKMLSLGEAPGTSLPTPQRVDVLHYHDAASSPTESQNEILSDWKQAQPADYLAGVLLWERAPVTGQNWQNHERAKRLLQLLQPLIESRGARSVKSLPEAPWFAQRDFDGGFLLVSCDEAPPTDNKVSSDAVPVADAVAAAAAAGASGPAAPKTIRKPSARKR